MKTERLENRIVYSLDNLEQETVKKAYSILAGLFESIDDLDYELDLPEGKILGIKLNNDEKISFDDFETLIYLMERMTNVKSASCGVEDGYNNYDYD